MTMTNGTKASNTIDKIVAKRLGKARMKAGWTQSDLGARLGVTFQQVQKYENGMNRISAGKLFIAAAILGVPVKDFFYGARPAAKREGLL